MVLPWGSGKPGDQPVVRGDQLEFAAFGQRQMEAVIGRVAQLFGDRQGPRGERRDRQQRVEELR